MSLDTPKPIPSEPGWYWALVADAPQHWHWSVMLVVDGICKIVFSVADDSPERVVEWIPLYHPGHFAEPIGALVPA